MGTIGILMAESRQRTRQRRGRPLGRYVWAWALVIAPGAFGWSCASSGNEDAVRVSYEPMPSVVAESSAPAGSTVQPEVGGESALESEPVPTLEELPLEIPVAQPEEEPVDFDSRLKEALETYESAGIFWEEGNFEEAFDALDRAYELMASVPGNGDPVRAQGKEDLRRLISRRIVEMYASRQVAVGDINLSIPVVLNDYVQREIDSFRGPEKAFFLESYRRSGLYRPMILAALREAGLPEQISWLPLVESGFKVRALSRARALGLWQFISSTGYRYGLQRTWWVDERMDPEKATLGAIGYLTDLHTLFGDWTTALAAYNCGEGNVLKQIKRQKVSYFDDFWDLYSRLPRETRRYVPRFLAVLAILEDPEAYGMDLPEPLPPLQFEKVEIERAAQLEELDRAMNLDQGTLKALNSELRRGATPPEPYELKIPPAKGEALLASLEALPAWTPPTNATGVHRVRKGESLSVIAERYGTSVSTLMDMNNIRSANRIWPGQQIRVPDRYRGSTASAQRLAPGTEISYTVRTGDSLWQLASRYGTTVERIRRDNSLSSSVLQPGQRLTIRGSGGGSGGITYVVRRGDTLGTIARAQGVSLSRLMSANGLSRRSTIYPGQQLSIPR